ncbi:ABC transporter permease [Mucisphaera sp.]|uniref:ABC transporter permease n=1 Tax=Mucisphaera sp. TaxID=2913024 RepID=UPI003D149DF1
MKRLPEQLLQAAVGLILTALVAVFGLAYFGYLLPGVIVGIALTLASLVVLIINYLKHPRDSYGTYSGLFAIATLVAWAGSLTSLILGLQGFAETGNLISLIGLCLGLVIFTAACFYFRNLHLVATITAYVGSAALTWIAVQACLLFGWIPGVTLAVGVYVMGLAYVLGMRLIRFLLRPGHPILGIARTLIDESVRMRVPLVFLILLLLLVPALPLIMDPAERLEYRVASFLSWSMIAASGLLSLLTIFLAVGSVATEFSQKQIFLTLTKPVARWQYLLGKWLGIVMLNALLVAVASGGIYAFTTVVAAQRAIDPADRAGVDTQVLAARIAIEPQMASADELNARFLQQVQRLRLEQPDTYGDLDDPIDRLSPTAVEQIRLIAIADWLSIAPRNSQTYTFDNLREAKALGGNIQLRIEPNAAGQVPNGMVELRMRLNNRPYIDRVFPDGRITLSEDTHHVLDIPTSVIDDQGVLRIQLINSTPGQPSISFNPADGMQLLYRVDTFENNFFRASLLLWTRLAFLAMAGLAAASFLGFPVACLLAILIFAGASGSAFLDESLTWFGDRPPSSASTLEVIAWYPSTFFTMLTQGEIVDAAKVVIRGIGRAFMLLVPSFHEYTATESIAKGLYISWMTVLSALLWVAGIWTAVIYLIGYLLLSKREPAEVIV